MRVFFYATVVLLLYTLTVDGSTASCRLEEEESVYNAIPNTRPWVTLIWLSCPGHDNNTVFRSCEGALIHPSWVLTTTSCFTQCKQNDHISATVDIGVQYSNIRKELASGRENYERLHAEKVYFNTQLDSEFQSKFSSNASISNGLALLKLDTTIKDKSRVISLPKCSSYNSGSSPNGTEYLEPAASGDGEGNTARVNIVSSFGGPLGPSDQLRDMTVAVMERDQCNHIIGDDDVADGLLCGTHSTWIQTPLLTDSLEDVLCEVRSDCTLQEGAPLVTAVVSNCTWSLTGLLSSGFGCHLPYSGPTDSQELLQIFPGLFINVCPHLEWINSTIHQNLDSPETCRACSVPPRPPVNSYICGSSNSSVSVCCERGFSPRGHQEWSCEPRTGEWSSDGQIQCLPVKCPALPPPLHGSSLPASCNDTAVSGSCWFSCEDGYSLSSGNGLLTCTVEGVWSANPPNCIAVDCGVPPSGGSLLASYSSTVINSTAYYTCSECYKMADESQSQLVCGKDGVWSGEKPMCKLVHCPAVVAPLFGFTDHTSLQCGSRVRFSCQPYFYLNGSSEAECLGNGKWSYPTPECQAVTCDAPVVRWSNLTDQTTSYSYGTVLTVECDYCRTLMVGGVPVEQANISCGLNGAWDGLIPTCEWAQCPLPGLLANGIIKPLGHLYFCGTTVQFSCGEGYRVRGALNSTCSQNETWSQEFPTCEVIPMVVCPSPPLPSVHSHYCPHSDTTGYLNNTVHYCCDEGFQEVGVVSGVSCEESGVWLGELAQCKPITCPTPDLPDPLVISRAQLGHSSGEELTYSSRHSREFSYGTRLTIGCAASRYSLKGSPYMTCGEAGQWSQQPPVCEDTGCSVGCPLPEAPRNGRIVSIFRPGQGVIPGSALGQLPGAIAGDVVVMVCNYGHYIHGSSSRRCSSNGVWTGMQPQCLNVDSPDSVFIFRNPVNVSRWEHTDSAHFLSTHSVYLACQVTDSRTGLALPIRKIDGPQFDRKVRTLSRSNGDPARSTQLAIQPRNSAGGRTMAGIYLCQVQSTSNQSVIINKTITIHIHDVFCPPPLPPAHGRLLSVNTLPGSCVSHQCDSGYTLLGQKERSCLASGEWSSPIPQCFPTATVTCSSAPTVSNAFLTSPASSYLVNDTVSYSCVEGYSISGDATIQCRGNNVWSALPSCVKKQTAF